MQFMHHARPLGGVFQKSIFTRFIKFWRYFPTATRKWLQERGRDTHTKGLVWFNSGTGFVRCLQSGNYGGARIDLRKSVPNLSHLLGGGACRGRDNGVHRHRCLSLLSQTPNTKRLVINSKPRIPDTPPPPPLPFSGVRRGRGDLIATSVCDKNSVGPSIRPTCTRCCATMTNVIQVSSNVH